MQLKFQAGDKVTMINDAGIRFPGKTILKVDESEFGKTWGPRYFIAPIDTPWYSFKESNLQKESA